MSLIGADRVERDRGLGGDRPAGLGGDAGSRMPAARHASMHDPAPLGDAWAPPRRRRRGRRGRRRSTARAGRARAPTGRRRRRPGGRSRPRTPGCRCGGGRRPGRPLGDAAARSTALARSPDGHAEAELRVDLAGLHELVGVGLDAGGGPQQHRRDRARRPRAAGRAGRARRSCRPRCGRRRPRGPGPARRRSCCCRGGRAGRRGRRRPAPRAARRRWRRRGACPPRGRGGPWPGTGTPCWRRPTPVAEGGHAPRGSGPAGGPRRRRTAGCRTRRPGPVEHPPMASHPSSPTGRVGQQAPRHRPPRCPCTRRGVGPAPGIGDHGHRSHGGSRAVTSTPGRHTPEQVEADGEADARRLDQPQAGLGRLGRDVLTDDAAVVVEAVEPVGQLAHPGRDLVRRPVVARQLDHLGQRRQRAQQLELALVGRAATRSTAARSARVDAQLARPSCRSSGCGRGRTARRRRATPGTRLRTLSRSMVGAWSIDATSDSSRMTSGPMSSTRSSRSTALPSRLPMRPLASDTIWPMRTSRRSLSTPSASTPACRLATWPWWSAPHTLMTRSKPRTRNLLRW